MSASATEKSRKSLEDISNLEKNDPDTINIHCAKGEKGDKGDVGGKREPEWIYKQQVGNIDALDFASVVFFLIRNL